MRVDGQLHVVSPDRERYPLDPTPIEGEAWYDRPGLSAEDLLSQMDEAGIDRAVLVQARSAYRYDNRYTADSALAYPDRFTASCVVDPDGDPVADVRYWVGERGARGIRLMFQRQDASWLDGPVCDAVLDELAGRGAVAQVVATAGQLGQVLGAARRHPEVMLVVDHCGYPDLSGGRGLPNARPLFELVDAPNVVVKLTSHVFSWARRDGAGDRVVAETVVEAFGAQRVMWASDFTIHGGTYRACVAEAEEVCAGLGPQERQLVLGQTAAALWWPQGVFSGGTH